MPWPAPDADPSSDDRTASDDVYAGGARAGKLETRVVRIGPSICFPLQPSPVSDRWYLSLCRVLSAIYYHRMVVVGHPTPVNNGSVLYVGLHRNGAVDGLLYKRAFPRATFLIAAQLTRSAFGRLFFTGIPVTREGDRGDRSGNRASLDRCVEHLVHGGVLFVLPEGTSDLGPKHLPFKPGVARILERALAAGATVTVIPVGLCYRNAPAFRSDVTLVTGPAIATELPASISPEARAQILMQRITVALERIGINCESAEQLAHVECLAGIAAEAPGADYYAALKAMERAPGMPSDVVAAWQTIERGVADGTIATERGIPVLSRHGAVWNVAWFALQSLVTAAAAVVNLPPLLAAWLAGRRLADARNTITLWRLLVGATAALLWALGVLTTLTVTGYWGLEVGYLVVTAAGLACYPALVARWPRLRNHRHRAWLAPALERVGTWVRACAANDRISRPDWAREPA